MESHTKASIKTKLLVVIIIAFCLLYAGSSLNKNYAYSQSPYKMESISIKGIGLSAALGCTIGLCSKKVFGNVNLGNYSYIQFSAFGTIVFAIAYVFACMYIESLLKSEQKRHLDIAKYLISKGVDMDAKNQWGGTTLHESARDGYLDCVAYLVQAGADINARSNHWCTALMCSAQRGHLDCVQYLVEAGAYIHYKDNDEDTALMCAVIGNKLDVVKYLVERGAGIHEKNKKGYTALQWAKEKGYSGIEGYLRSQGAK